MRDILISTAGTSLLTNLSKSSDEDLKKMVDHGDAKKISKHLCSIESNDWICGAEINSVNSIIEKDLLDINYFHLILVSDTLVGKILSVPQQQQNRNVLQALCGLMRISSIEFTTAKTQQKKGHEAYAKHTCNNPR